MTRTAKILSPLFASLLSALCLATVGCTDAVAQTYPTRPIRLIVPAGAGGALDISARAITQKVSQNTPYTFVIENKPGANWVIGMDAAAKAAPDGYTLLSVPSTGITLTPFLTQNLPLDPSRDLVPIVTAQRSPFVLLVRSQLGANNLGEFIAYLRAHPGKLNHAYNSPTTLLISEFLKARANSEYVNVAYRSAAQAIQATVEGSTDFTFADLGTSLPMIESKTLRALAITTETRYKLAPNIPTFTEQGIDNFAVSTAGLFFAPLHTPAPIIADLNKVFRQALKSPELAAWFAGNGQDAVSGSPDVAAQFLAAEKSLWESLIKTRNIKFER